MTTQSKKALTFEQRITVAWAHYVRGIQQHDLAAIYDVNSGRISEACTAVKEAVMDTRGTN